MSEFEIPRLCGCGTHRRFFQILYSFAIPFRGKTRVFFCPTCSTKYERDIY